MDEELNDYISFVINKLNKEYPEISKSINSDLNKLHGLNGVTRKIHKIFLLKHKHPYVLTHLMSLLNRKFQYNFNIGYKVCTFFNSPYLMSAINSEPVEDVRNGYIF